MVTRRVFLQSTAAGVGLLAESSLRRGLPRLQANEEIRIGYIGLGAHGKGLLRMLFRVANAHNVRIVSVCDVWSRQFADLAPIASVENYDTSSLELTDDYRRVLERDDIDAVVIATPDFSHFQIAMDALSAGKDIYLEKPMTFTLEQAQILRDAVNASDRIVQIGTQFASDPGYAAASAIVASGVLGTISRVHIARNYYQQRWLVDYSDVQANEVNWSLFLTGLPEQAFDARLLRQWKLFRKCCHGIAGVFIPHFFQAVHSIMNVAHPRSAVTHGGIYVWDDGRENPDTLHTLLEYDPGFMVSFEMAFGNSSGADFLICGTEGTLDIHNWQLTPAGGSPASTVVESLIPEGISQIEGSMVPRINLHELHLGNWIDCMRSRATPAVPVDLGYNQMVAVTLANDAYWSGVRQIHET